MLGEDSDRDDSDDPRDDARPVNPACVPQMPGHGTGNVRPGDDAWLAFSYLVAGVGVYGLLGWALGRWLHVRYLAPAGILVGALFGLWLVVARFVRHADRAVDSDTDGTDIDSGRHRNRNQGETE